MYMSALLRSSLIASMAGGIHINEASISFIFRDTKLYCPRREYDGVEPRVARPKWLASDLTVTFQPLAVLYATADRCGDIGKRLVSVKHKAKDSLLVAVEISNHRVEKGKEAYRHTWRVGGHRDRR